MKDKKYFCPMHPEVTSEKAGNCPKCGMRLVSAEVSKVPRVPQEEDKIAESYWPLIVIIGFITLVTVVLTIKDYLAGNFMIKSSMSYFMAGFFLTFSAFKFLDLKGFADGYSTYDLLAQKVYNYGYVYPFLELGLGPFLPLY